MKNRVYVLISYVFYFNLQKKGSGVNDLEFLTYT